MIKKLLLTFIIIGGLAAIGFICLKGKRHEIVITQAQLEEKLAEKFPVSKKHLLILELTYSNPELTLLPESNQVRVGLDAALAVSLERQTPPLNGGITVLADLRYNKDTQAFHLDKAIIERMDIDGIPEKWEKTVSKLATDSANLYFQKHPIYELKNRDAKNAAAKALLKDFKIQDQSIMISIGI